jgi:hypothetical protein
MNADFERVWMKQFLASDGRSSAADLLLGGIQSVACVGPGLIATAATKSWEIPRFQGDADGRAGAPAAKFSVAVGVGHGNSGPKGVRKNGPFC